MKSIPVNPGEQARASEYNDLRDDVISSTSGSFVYGETIAVNDAVYLEDGITTRESVERNVLHNTDADLFSANWDAQTFTTSSDTIAIRSVTLLLRRMNNPTGNIVVSIRNVSGDLPIGADLVVATLPASSIPTTNTEVEFVFPSPLAVTGNTRYAIVISATLANSFDRPIIRLQNTNVYANGRRCTSSNSGSSWTGQTQDLFFRISEQFINTAISSRVFRTSASFNDRRIHNFVGFAKEAGVSGNTGRVQTAGSVEGFSSLLTGVEYFLSDTAGAISTTAGTNRMSVGVAVSATGLFVFQGTRKNYVDERRGLIYVEISPVGAADPPNGVWTDWNLSGSIPSGGLFVEVAIWHWTGGSVPDSFGIRRNASSVGRIMTAGTQAGDRMGITMTAELDANRVVEIFRHRGDGFPETRFTALGFWRRI